MATTTGGLARDSRTSRAFLASRQASCRPINLVVANAVKHEQADQQHWEPEEENEHELKVVHEPSMG